MIRLIFSDLREHAATWVGALIVAVGCGFIGGWVASLQTTADAYGGHVHWMLRNAVSGYLMFSVLAAVAVLISAANLTVAVQRRSYALWQLVGVSPRRVGAIVLAQLVVVAVVGSLVGTLVAAAIFAPLLPWTLSSAEVFTGVVPRVDLGRMPMVWLVVAAVFVIGGARGARSASRTPPISALRDPEQRVRRMTLPRAALALALIGCVAWIRATMVRLLAQDPSSWFNMASWGLLIPVFLAATLVAAAPVVLPAVLTVWTSIVPQRRGTDWWLARHAAREGLSASASIETPVMVGVSIVAGLYSVIGVLGGYAHAQGDTGAWMLDFSTGLMFLGGPVLLCAIGAAVSVVMSSGSRTRDIALLSAAGARPKTLVAAAAFEALIHAVTSTLLGMGAAAAAAALIASVFGRPLLADMALGEGLIVSVAGFLLILTATLMPTLSALRRDIVGVLAAQD
ncbi:protein of unknown function DUF214 [Coriobacterium glomerans PW2]|uniref:ABC3 transporter permease C-terminal domain-containing protein n=1 Tax=Coriobacterium glomerans (strain ATCC 49209 / DSM 20642 / JCM 10262 / PW2) TaxID=700015 RepID=F2N903_CORGP|nr:FtsX-like permease family protein [Coriobacterium glomerans]AEB07603.1 protein of unknown function DUF214 [Coriobacterium glomerans PW2]